MCDEIPGVPNSGSAYAAAATQLSAVMRLQASEGDALPAVYEPALKVKGIPILTKATLEISHADALRLRPRLETLRSAGGAMGLAATHSLELIEAAKTQIAFLEIDSDITDFSATAVPEAEIAYLAAPTGYRLSDAAGNRLQGEMGELSPPSLEYVKRLVIALEEVIAKLDHPDDYNRLKSLLDERRAEYPDTGQPFIGSIQGTFLNLSFNISDYLINRLAASDIDRAGSSRPDIVKLLCRSMVSINFTASAKLFAGQNWQLVGKSPAAWPTLTKYRSLSSELERRLLAATSALKSQLSCP